MRLFFLDFHWRILRIKIRTGGWMKLGGKKGKVGRARKTQEIGRHCWHCFDCLSTLNETILFPFLFSSGSVLYAFVAIFDFRPAGQPNSIPLWAVFAYYPCPRNWRFNQKKVRGKEGLAWNSVKCNSCNRVFGKWY